MKKFIYSCLLLLMCLPLAAEQKRNNFEVAFEASGYKYQEPHMENTMSLSGRKVGISATYLRRGVTSEFFDEEDPTFALLELRYMTGDVDYDGWTCDEYTCTSFKANNLNDYYFEVVLKTGKMFQLSQTWEVGPYLGVGWRYLRDHLEESGEAGYLRESSYIYMPLGTTLSYYVNEGFKLTLTGEFDWLLNGHQYSDLYGGINNAQDQGYGLRAGVRATWAMSDAVSMFVEPFWRYWHIQNSDGVYVRVGSKMYVMSEPFNTTSEYGLRVGVAF